MNWIKQILICVVFAMVTVSGRAERIAAIPANAPTVPTNILPPLQLTSPSPVTFFRQLLVMTPMERNQALTNRSPDSRARIMAKLREYLSLDPNERELRLRATELRWYLAPLLRQPTENREASLDRVPEDLRALVAARLQQWAILPPTLQKSLLENEKAMQLLAQTLTNSALTLTEEQQRLAGQFNQFFELTPKEKARTLGTLSQAERTAMEKTLKTFEALPPKQRSLCVRNYAKFAGMSAGERAEFLKNAEQWARMSPAERQSWRTLVSQVPQMPPLPPAIIPANLMPPVPQKTVRPSMATN